MLGSATRRPVAAVVVILGALAGPSPVEAERSACEEAVGRAVRLLPRQPDRIVVLDAGRVVGIGRHAELLETNETYREIVFSQLSAEEVAA